LEVSVSSSWLKIGAQKNIYRRSKEAARLLAPAGFVLFAETDALASHDAGAEGKQMDWSGSIDAYCERTGPEFWAEPLNAVSNGAFLLAALYGARLAWRDGDGWLGALAAIAAAVGVGSFLFHTLATRWAALADVAPIAVFIGVSFALVLVRRIGLAPITAIVATAAFLAASPFVSGVFAPLMGGSAGYAPAFLALLGVGFWLALADRPGAATLVTAAVVFGLSLSMRMADDPLCSLVPFGTHVFWHILNAVVLALVLRAASRSSGVDRRQDGTC
jgi:hypothetical protein